MTIFRTTTQFPLIADIADRTAESQEHRPDLLDTAELVQLFVEEDRQPQYAVAAASDAISAAVDGRIPTKGRREIVHPGWNLRSARRVGCRRMSSHLLQ